MNIKCVFYYGYNFNILNSLIYYKFITIPEHPVYYFYYLISFQLRSNTNIVMIPFPNIEKDKIIFLIYTICYFYNIILVRFLCIYTYISLFICLFIVPTQNNYLYLPRVVQLINVKLIFYLLIVSACSGLLLFFLSNIENLN